MKGGATIALGLVQLYYVTCGAADDPTILYIHGNLGSHRWFSEVMEISGARTVALDMPNFGRSDHIDEHSIAAYTDHVARFIDEVVGREVVLVGHSLGGGVAMGVATTRPELVAGLVLADSLPINGLVTPEAYHPAIEAYRTNEDKLRAALKMVVPTLDDDAWFELLVTDAQAMKGEAYVGHAVELGTVDFTESASNYTGPTLVLRGTQDVIISAEMADRTARAFDTEVKELANVGHSPMVEDPETFRRVVEEFVSSL